MKNYTGEGKKSPSRLLLTIIVSVMVLLLYYGFRITHQTTFDPASLRYRNAVRIGNALYRYQEELGGALPTRLSELVPQYVGPSNAGWFLEPLPRQGAAEVDDNIEHVRLRIDKETAFIYLGTRGYEEDLVLYEQPQLWTRGEGTMIVATLSSNHFTLKLRAATDVLKTLRHIR